MEFYKDILNHGKNTLKPKQSSVAFKIRLALGQVLVLVKLNHDGRFSETVFTTTKTFAM